MFEHGVGLTHFAASEQKYEGAYEKATKAIALNAAPDHVQNSLREFFSMLVSTIRCNGVAQLSRESAFAEIFLANADRGLDASTLARDVIDLACMAELWGMPPARAGLRLAEAAYGDDVQRKLDHAIGKIQSDRLWRQQCERGLNLDRPKVLRAGLEKLQATRWRKAPARHGKPSRPRRCHTSHGRGGRPHLFYEARGYDA